MNENEMVQKFIDDLEKSQGGNTADFNASIAIIVSLFNIAETLKSALYKNNKLQEFVDELRADCPEDMAEDEKQKIMARRQGLNCLCALEEHVLKYMETQSGNA